MIKPNKHNKSSKHNEKQIWYRAVDAKTFNPRTFRFTKSTEDPDRFSDEHLDFDDASEMIEDLPYDLEYHYEDKHGTEYSLKQVESGKRDYVIDPFDKRRISKNKLKKIPDRFIAWGINATDDPRALVQMGYGKDDVLVMFEGICQGSNWLDDGWIVKPTRIIKFKSYNPTTGTFANESKKENRCSY